MEEHPELLKKKSIVLYQPHWHKGVVGIAASRIAELYYKPTIILTQSNGKLAGSARSVGDFDIHRAIGQCADLLEQFWWPSACCGAGACAGSTARF